MNSRLSEMPHRHDGLACAVDTLGSIDSEGFFNIPVMTWQRVCSGLVPNDMNVMLSFTEELLSIRSRFFCRAVGTPLDRALTKRVNFPPCNNDASPASEGVVNTAALQEWQLVNGSKLDYFSGYETDRQKQIPKDYSQQGVVRSDQYVLELRHIATQKKFTVSVWGSIEVCKRSSSSLLRVSIAVLQVEGRPCVGLNQQQVRAVKALFKNYLTEMSEIVFTDYQYCLGEKKRVNIGRMCIAKISQMVLAVGHSHPERTSLFQGAGREPERVPTLAFIKEGESGTVSRNDLALLFSVLIDGHGAAGLTSETQEQLSAALGTSMSMPSPETQKMIHEAIIQSTRNWQKFCPAWIYSLLHSAKDETADESTRLSSESVLSTAVDYLQRNRQLRQRGMEWSENRQLGQESFKSVGFSQLCLTGIHNSLLKQEYGHMVLDQVAISEDSVNSENYTQRLDLLKDSPPWNQESEMISWGRFVSPSRADAAQRYHSLRYLRQ
ncbi:MAG: hypothetical protein HQL65_10090 [Magnetococcales bacterium]|nr:hypothetical protein [Magnetococcales bacterium]